MTNPIVLAATMRTAHMACRILNIPPHKHARTAANLHVLRGVASDTTIYLVHSPESMPAEVLEQIEVMKAIGATVIGTSLETLGRQMSPPLPRPPVPPPL